ncbi:MAG: glycosyltransferase involved in cell wall biosynthesis [Flavobacteriales bacterium]
MKVLQLIDTLDLGGAERMAVNLANTFAEEGQSYLCATRNEGPLLADLSPKVTYNFLARKSSYDIPAIFRLRKFIKAHGIQIIHAHSISVHIGLAVRILFPKVKLIWHDHYGNSELLDQRPTAILRFAASYFSAVIAVNQNLKMWAVETLKTPADKAFYLPNFAQLSTVKEHRTIPGKEGKRMVCLANLRPQKNHPFLIRSFAKWLKNNPEWDLLLAGKIFNDSYFEDLKSLISKLNLQEKVHILGSRTDVGEILQTSDIGILSSSSEGLPLSLLEYGMANLPCIATNVGEVGEVLKNGELEYLIESNNEIDFLNAMNSIVTDSEGAKDKSKAFNKHIKLNYSQKAVMSKLIMIYKTAIKA